MKQATQQVVEKDEVEKAGIAKRLVFAEFMFITAVAMVIPTRAPMVLTIKKGDAAATGRVLGLMSSSAALIELFVNPVFGQLSDMFGRKPFFAIAPAIDAILHTLVSVFPSALPVTFVDRAITGSMIFAFKAPLTAALSDLFSGADLAIWLARQNAMFGLGLGIGPFIGSKLGGAASFFWSSVVFLMTLAYTQISVPETLALSNRKQFNPAACSPLRFLKLFSNRMMSTLATTVGLQSFGDYLNVYDINYLYLKSVFDAGQTEIGQYASAVGVTQFINGQVMTRIIQTVGRKNATLLSNAMWCTAMALLGRARSLPAIVASLFFMCGGHSRNSAVSAYIQQHGASLGMGKAEIAGAQANLLALLKVFIPVFYGNVFAMATSKGRSQPGLPYFIIALTTALSQLCFWTVDPEQHK